MLYPISLPKPSSAEDLIGFINAEGQIVVSPVYSRGGHFSEGKASVIDDTGKSGFIDYDGKLVLPCRFRGLGVFKNGLCSIEGGFINHSGAWFIEPRLAVASQFSEGCAFASLDGESFGFIDLSGEFCLPPRFQQCTDFSSGLAAVLIEGRWGYIDQAGAMRIPSVFEGSLAHKFRFGLAGVQIDRRWGFVDQRGMFLIKPQYENVKKFSEGYAAVQLGHKWGAINVEGKRVVNFEFDELGEFEGGMAVAKLAGHAGFVSPSGGWLIPPEFTKTHRFYGQLAAVQKGDVYRYIRRNGTVVWVSEPGAIVQTPPLPF